VISKRWGYENGIIRGMLDIISYPYEAVNIENWIINGYEGG